MDIKTRDKTVIVELTLNESSITELLTNEGYKIEEHNFGEWKKIDHGRQEWKDDIRPGIKIGKLWYRPENAFSIVFAEYHVTSVVIHKC